MKRIIKLTEKQLNEATDNGFNYLNGGDVPNYSGQTFISATGKIKQDEYGKPTTSDMVGNSLSSQTFDRYNLTTQTYRQKTNENDEFLPNLNKEKKTNIDDSNDIEDAEEEITIPMGIESKLDMLIKALESTKMTPKQRSVVLNKIVERLPLDNIPFAWKKELISKIKK